MSGSNGHVSRLAEFKKRAQQEFTGPSGMVYTTIQPKPMHLIRAGLPSVCFLPSLTREQRIAENAKAFEVLEKDNEKALEFAKGLIYQCVLDPLFFDGDVQYCPEDLLAWDYVEEDIHALFNHLLVRAGYLEAKQAAKAAEAFRGDSDGGPAQPGGEVLPRDAEPAPQSAAQ